MTFLQSRKKKGKHAVKLMNGRTLCDFTYTVCANRHICLLALRSLLCANASSSHPFASSRGEAGGGVRSVTLPTERAFMLGLSEPTQGEIVGCWERTGDVEEPPSPGGNCRPRALWPQARNTHTHTHTNKGGVCVCMIAYSPIHKERQLSKEIIGQNSSSNGVLGTLFSSENSLFIQLWKKEIF